ncbi:hypothetical protein Sme01_12590 [Sphaerisporangium melleum]|uniref:Uncharacterized protein n=1 Tax=Sphaerisporangium melleum TaxID=321316 RepID=A0A917RHV6_9ACTN|nr:hypothetical protein [Sphaerisporangium melleum]GGL08818.1 hypothetical protein GCM10007964_58840 [Sphaerisporangium melleum]GII68783.1 hypothetical protein Sme01_12590 [Sphaerisporangium melleum]
MGYELRVQRESPLAYAELSAVTAPVDTGLELRGTPEAGQVFARHGESEHAIAIWQGRLYGEPTSDWQVAQLARLAAMLGGRLAGEDGETYVIRDGIVEQVSGETTYEFGKLEEILSLGPAQWST